MFFVTCFWKAVVKNGHNLLDHGTLLYISQELMRSAVLNTDTNLGKLNVNLIIIARLCSKWARLFRSRWLKSGVSQKRFDELSRLIAWFLRPESDWIVFGLTTNLLCIFEICWESTAVVFVKNVLLQWCPQEKFVGNMAKGRISQRVFHENKACQIFWKKTKKKTNHFSPLFLFQKIWRALLSWNTRFEIRRFALLPTSRRTWFSQMLIKIDKCGKIVFCLMHTSRKYGKWPEI